jgi:hypothetical protein
MSNGESSVVEFGKEVTLLGEVVVTGRKVGADKAFWSKLAHDQELFAKIVAFSRQTFSLIEDLAWDNRINGRSWKLLRDLVDDKGEFKPELLNILEAGERYIDEADAAARIYEEGNCLAGQRHAEAMLRDPAKIPEEFKSYELLFPGTVWQDSRGVKYVACLRCYKDIWAMDFHALKNGHNENQRIVRIAI